MKKALSIALLFGALAASAESYLYWMVGNEESQYDYSTVKVAAKDSSGSVQYLNLYYGDWSSAGSSIASDTTDAYTAAGVGLWADLGSYASSSYTFAIELWSGSKIAQSMASGAGDYANSWYSYSALANYIVNSPMSTPVAALTPTAYGVPEPNSALLLVLGSALLALKRRKMAKA